LWDEGRAFEERGSLGRGTILTDCIPWLLWRKTWFREVNIGMVGGEGLTTSPSPSRKKRKKEDTKKIFLHEPRIKEPQDALD